MPASGPQAGHRHRLATATKISISGDQASPGQRFRGGLASVDCGRRSEGGHMARVRNLRDLLAGLLFVAFGVAALVISQAYEIGAASRMGPGYFPRAARPPAGRARRACWRCAASGRRRSRSPAWRWRPLLVVLAGVASLHRGGAAAGPGRRRACCSSSSRRRRARSSGGRRPWSAAPSRARATVAVFVYGLGIPLPVWPVFLAGGQ